MKVQNAQFKVLPMIPVDDDTRDMLAYAASPEGRARIERGRQEIREGKFITGIDAFAKELKRRIKERRA